MYRNKDDSLCILFNTPFVRNLVLLWGSANNRSQGTGAGMAGPKAEEMLVRVTADVLWSHRQHWWAEVLWNSFVKMNSICDKRHSLRAVV